MQTTKWMGLLVLLAGCASTAPPPSLTRPVYEDPAEEAYRTAERFFQAGDFDWSLLHADRALRTNPAHVPARALAAELRFILGFTRMDGIAESQLRRDQIDALLAASRWQLFFGALFTAEHQAQRVLELAPMVPAMMDIESRVAQAWAILEWVQAFRED